MSIQLQFVRKHRCTEDPCPQKCLDIPQDDDEIIGVMVYSTATDTKLQATLAEWEQFLSEVKVGVHD
jgi:hypothetical protein